MLLLISLFLSCLYVVGCANRGADALSSPTSSPNPVIMMTLFTPRSGIVKGKQITVQVEALPSRDFLAFLSNPFLLRRNLPYIKKQIKKMSKFHARFLEIVAKHGGTGLQVELQRLDSEVGEFMAQLEINNPEVFELIGHKLVIPSEPAVIISKPLQLRNTSITIPHSVHQNSFSRLVKSAMDVSLLKESIWIPKIPEFNQVIMKAASLSLQMASKSSLLWPIRFTASALQYHLRTTAHCGLLSDQILAKFLASGVNPRVLACVSKRFFPSSVEIVERAAKVASIRQMIRFLEHEHPYLMQQYSRIEVNRNAVKERAVSNLLSIVYFKSSNSFPFSKLGFTTRTKFLAVLLNMYTHLSIVDRFHLLLLPWIRHLSISISVSEWYFMVDWVLAGTRHDAAFLRRMIPMVASSSAVDEVKILCRMVVKAYFKKFEGVPMMIPPTDIFNNQSWIDWARRSRL